MKRKVKTVEKTVVDKTEVFSHLIALTVTVFTTPFIFNRSMEMMDWFKQPSTYNDDCEEE